jgi:hypothetical protein
VFDETLYHLEMSRLLVDAAEALRQRHPRLVVYTVSIWTDPNAAASAVSFDTAQNSAEKVAQAAEWAAGHYARAVAAKDLATAEQFAPRDGPMRNVNPADFALRAVSEIDHQSFVPGWEERSAGRCWVELEPALERVRASALELYSELTLHEDAVLGSNSRSTWFDRPVRFH